MTEAALNMNALDALFGMAATSYDMLILDLPTAWHSWTTSIISASDLVVVTGLNTVPGLRQVASTLATVKSVGLASDKVVVALNRCEARLLGGIARGNHVNKILAGEQVVTVRDDAKATVDSANTGIPIAIGQSSSRINKDIQALAAIMGKAGRGSP
jgi:Flp pilus assembly CpaE family ATPase